MRMRIARLAGVLIGFFSIVSIDDVARTSETATD
ncbi:hypothetical protein X741_29655 [Mesorhizobium sp. LNHC229A00]|nr:hypothetical protein X741_29655 [Mesorhizobium sp. LNHC229A00]